MAEILGLSVLVISILFVVILIGMILGYIINSIFKDTNLKHSIIGSIIFVLLILLLIGGQLLYITC